MDQLLPTISQVATSVGPVFFIIALGLILRERGFFEKQFFSQLNRFCFFFGLPALLVVKISKTTLGEGESLQATLVLAFGLVAGYGIGTMVSRVLGLPPARHAAFVQAAFRSNMMYVGLPVIVYALADRNGGAGGEAAQSLAMLAVAPMIPFYNIASVWVLCRSREAGEESVSIAQIFWKMLTNPLVLGCIAGLLLAGLRWKLPHAIERSLLAIGQMSLPAALLAVGGGLSVHGVTKQFGLSLTTALIKTAAVPLLGYMVCQYLELSADATMVTLLFLACPTAISSYVMAEQLGGDADLANSAVVFSTALSVISLSTVVVLLA